MPQDWQRYLLLIGLAVLAYLLVLQWNEDYGGVSEQQMEDYAPELSSQTEGDSPLGLEPKEDRSDVPDASLLARTQARAPREVDEEQGQAVHVNTAVLDIWIDLVGGDVVRARLPKHPLSLETLDIAFPLLDRGNGREYVAQSGLVGPDGTDDASGRPVYRSARQSYTSQEGQTLEVTLEMLPKLGKEHVRVEKVYRFAHEDY
ncbi:MAG: membrane protein insertase YidC, partial [Gammaproteobacteria bacterium]|nr:membrane protein insertase YidC [Gammaproteobacteria bacterium]